MFAAYGLNYSGDRLLLSRPRHGDARVVEVEACERGGEAVRVAFAPGLAVGDDVEARLLLRPDGEERGVVLRLREIGLRNAPQLGGAHAGRDVLCQPLAVDQPVGLRVASHESRRK